MKRMMMLAAVLALLLPASALLASDGDKAEMDEHKNMHWVETADTLYHCPHHPDAVTAKEGRKCMAEGCSMPLQAMSEEQMKEFRSAEYKACPMDVCSVAVGPDSEMEACPHCGMKLKDVEHGEHHKPMQGDEGMMHEGHGEKQKKQASSES